MASIGVLTLELRLENSHSLKEKRHVVKGLRDRLHHKFNVSVAEIDCQDLWQRAVVAAGRVFSGPVSCANMELSARDEGAPVLFSPAAGRSRLRGSGLAQVVPT